MSEFEIKKHDESLTRTIRMKSSMIEQINMLAGESNISFNALVVQMCAFALENLKKPEEKSEQ